MKLELKTENESYAKSFSHLFSKVSILALLIISCNVALKLGIISRYYQINYKCRLLSIEKSTSNFKKLSSLSKLDSKQKIWEFCKNFTK